MTRQRPYIYDDLTISLCPTCLKRVYGKIVLENDHVYMLKTCSDHGPVKVLIATDIAYYKKCRDYTKRSETPLKFGTQSTYGCPYDCGLCTDHEQHSCSAVIEITDRCNLKCPTCYAASGPDCGSHRSVADVEKMFDIMVESEGEPDVIQISGGEPTIHPQFFEILDIAKTKPFKHILLNTNGIRISEEPGFAEKLATYMPQFEIYLQWDSLRPSVLKKLRGSDLSAIRKQALAKLNELNLSTTLVVVVEKGLNDTELGELVEFATQQKCVRGITFQPTQFAGRTDYFNPETDRISPSEIRQKIIAQQSIFTENDLIPVPCNADALTMAYGLKHADTVVPLTRYIDLELLRESSRNTIAFEKDAQIRNHLIRLFSTGNSPESSATRLHQLLCCLPKIAAPDMLKYDDVFRILIVHFQDAFDFDVRSIKKSCIHIVHPDGRIIPFETMNLFYRHNENNLKRLQNASPSFTG